MLFRSANPNAAIGAAGETGAMQVLPTTLKNPGFGVTPAQNNSPEEANRVGRDYYNAMLNRYTDPLQAAGAYNAGPGRVQQNLQANQGQLNVGQLPGETQGYLNKVLGGAGRAVTNMFPSAQAGTLPAGQLQQAPTVTPVAPQTQPAINPETGELYNAAGLPAPPRAPSATQQANQDALARYIKEIGAQDPEFVDPTRIPNPPAPDV